MPGMMDDVMDRVTRLSLQVASWVSHRDRPRISQLRQGVQWLQDGSQSHVHPKYRKSYITQKRLTGDAGQVEGMGVRDPGDDTWWSCILRQAAIHKKALQAQHADRHKYFSVCASCVVVCVPVSVGMCGCAYVCMRMDMRQEVDIGCHFSTVLRLYFSRWCLSWNLTLVVRLH